MSSHSIIGPSSASRRIPCPASATQEAKYPQPDTEDTLNGDASHWVGASALLGGWTPTDCVNLVGTNAPNGVVLTTEMVDAAIVYISTILAISGEGLKVEQPIRIPRVHEECFGTPDCWYFDVKTGTLHIFDYKYGYGWVEAFENRQAVDYYAGIIDELGIPDQYVRVIIYIIQPRPYHPDGSVRRWETTGADLRPYVNESHNAAHEALGPKPRYCTGAHCRYCKGRHACLSHQQAGYYSVDVSGTDPGRELTPGELGIELAILERAAKTIEYRLVGLGAQALELVRQGTPVPGRRMGFGAGSVVWIKPQKEVIALGDIMGVDFRKPEEPITPKQAEAKPIDKELLKQYCEHRSGAARLVVDDNSKTRQIFGGNKV